MADGLTDLNIRFILILKEVIIMKVDILVQFYKDSQKILGALDSYELLERALKRYMDDGQSRPNGYEYRRINKTIVNDLNFDQLVTT